MDQRVVTGLEKLAEGLALIALGLRQDDSFDVPRQDDQPDTNDGCEQDEGEQCQCSKEEMVGVAMDALLASLLEKHGSRNPIFKEEIDHQVMEALGCGPRDISGVANELGVKYHHVQASMERLSAAGAAERIEKTRSVWRKVQK